MQEATAATLHGSRRQWRIRNARTSRTTLLELRSTERLIKSSTNARRQPGRAFWGATNVREERNDRRARQLPWRRSLYGLPVRTGLKSDLMKEADEKGTRPLRFGIA